MMAGCPLLALRLFAAAHYAPSVDTGAAWA